MIPGRENILLSKRCRGGSKRRYSMKTLDKGRREEKLFIITHFTCDFFRVMVIIVVNGIKKLKEVKFFVNRFKLLVRWGLLYLSSWFVLSAIIVLFLLPYDLFRQHQYFDHHQYRTIQLIFFREFLYCLPISLAVVSLIYVLGYTWTIIRRGRCFSAEPKGGISKEGATPSKKVARSRKYIIGTAVIFLVIILSVNGGIAVIRLKGRPNVLLIVVDTLRQDYTAVCSGERNPTPVLHERLMPASFVFPRAFSNSSWTLPSIASLMTSRYPSAIGVKGLTSRLEDHYLTLAELLKEYGYFNVGIVSHLLLREKYGMAQGFDIYNDRNISDQLGNHFFISSPGISSDAADYIRKYGNRKFFLFLHYFDPHYLYIDHEGTQSYDGPFRTRSFDRLRSLVQEGCYGKRDIDFLSDCYRSEIRFTDRHIGDVIDALEEKGIFEKTLIILTSDHGEEFVERGGLGHGTTLYNEQVRIPLLIKLPAGLKQSDKQVERFPVSNIDLFPTIAALLEIDKPADCMGVDLFSRRSVKGHPIFCEIGHQVFNRKVDKMCVIQWPWKLIQDNPTLSCELYNLRLDSKESQNVIDHRQTQAARLRRLLARWRLSMRRLPGKKTDFSLTEKEQDRLKSLGYL